MGKLFRQLCAAWAAAALSVGMAQAFVLLPPPPAHGFTMNFDLGTNQISTIGFGTTTFNALAESAANVWNQIGIGPGLDHQFFSKRVPTVTGDPCHPDLSNPVNEVRWASDACGFAFGDALAFTYYWTLNGLRQAETMVFDVSRPWNAYSGPLRQASNGATLNDFYRVAQHEFGHAAGLDHPDEHGQVVVAIMNSHESDVDSPQTDDINGAHAIQWGTAPSTSVTPQTGWWWNPAEGGRGFTIEKRGSNLFLGAYLYDSSGRASWVVSAGPMNGSSYSGTLLQFCCGQSLTGAYKANTALPSPGTISVSFDSPTTGTLTWPGGTIPIQRFDIVTGGAAMTPPAGTPEAGWWWNAAESGRGFALEIQNGTMFLAGYMYDGSGNPVWYASGPTPMTNANTYQGVWTQYGNGQTLGGPYKPASVVTSDVGQITIQFSDTQNAVLTLPDGRQIAITRFLF